MKSFIQYLVSTAIFTAMFAVANSFAQVPDFPAAPPAPPTGAPSAPPPAPANPSVSGATTSKPPASGQSTFLGKDAPSFDPGSEILTWDGKNWNVNNNRLFAARFEKYLNAPEATSEQDRQYNAIISQILTRLAPGSATKENIDYSFRLLTTGSNYDVDARLCDALADAVY